MKVINKHLLINKQKKNVLYSFFMYFCAVLRAYKYELVLNDSQKEFMNKSFGCARFIYNYCLDRKTKLYETEKKRISQFDLCKEVVLLKKKEGFEWLQEIDHQTLSCAVMNLDKAFTKFFREKKGYPNFKSKHNSKQSAQFTQGVQIDFENNKIRFPKIGWCKVKFSREFDGLHKTVTVSRNSVGRYFVSILVDNDIPLPEKALINESTAVGIDVGIKHFATLSTGEKIDNPKYYEKSQKKLAVLQRRVSKKVKGSNRHKKAKLRVAKLHYKITNQRKDFTNKLSTKIVRENQSVIIEDLNVAGMLQNHCLAKSISSVSWSEFFSQLQYKCDWYGKNLIRIGRFEPSSRLCTCGVKNTELKLSDRKWTCKSCGVTHDRDLLAANNIKKFGLVDQNLIGEGIAEFKGVEKLSNGSSVKRQCSTLK